MLLLGSQTAVPYPFFYAVEHQMTAIVTLVAYCLVTAAQIFMIFATVSLIKYHGLAINHDIM